MQRECSTLLLAGLDLGLGSALDPLSLALDILGHLAVRLERLLDHFVLD